MEDLPIVRGFRRANARPVFQHRITQFLCPICPNWPRDVHSGDGRRYIVQSDELLAAFLELEAMLV
jgi:hypothetical protein